LRYFLPWYTSFIVQGHSQRKYALDISEESRILNAKLVDTPMDPNVILVLDQGELYFDPMRYK